MARKNIKNNFFRQKKQIEQLSQLSQLTNEVCQPVSTLHETLIFWDNYHRKLDKSLARREDFKRLSKTAEKGKNFSQLPEKFPPLSEICTRATLLRTICVCMQIA